VATLPENITEEVSEEQQQSALFFALQYRLYSHFYVYGIPQQNTDVQLAYVLSTPYVRQLSEANSGSGYLDGPWQIDSRSNTHLQVNKSGLFLSAPLEFCDQSGKTSKNRTFLKFPKEMFHISPGYYMAMSDTNLESGEKLQLVRLYWHLTPAGALEFMQTVTSLLNEQYVPFRLKVLNEPNHFNRCDAVVLYMNRNKFKKYFHIIERICVQVKEHLLPGTPALTKALSQGVGFAEDPGDGSSFGLNRCGVIAKGILNSYRDKSSHDLELTLRAVENEFKSGTLNLSTPYVNSGSKDQYPDSFRQKAEKPRSYREAASDVEAEAAVDKMQILEVARQVGDQIVDSAHWVEDRCTWLGSMPGEQAGSGGPQMVIKSLDVDLYNGTCGIALFLGELYGQTGEEKYRKASLGAIEHTQMHLENIEPEFRKGFYTGWLGIAVACVRLANLLKAESLVQSANQIIDSALNFVKIGKQFDFLRGDAGAILGLLSLREQLHRNDLLEVAKQLGDRLIETAHIDSYGASWRSEVESSIRNLTGLSHGTAGVAYALSQLFAVTSEERYKNTAEQAFEYERSCFDPEAKNWPDYRINPFIDKENSGASFTVAWCHGAAGIGISRLKAYKIFDDPKLKDEINCALSTTKESLEQALIGNPWDFSPCHGISGLAEILYLEQEALSENSERVDNLIHQTIVCGVNKYSIDQGCWPLGFNFDNTPSLFTGLAGVGYFYLRMYDHKIPTLLAI